MPKVYPQIPYVGMHLDPDEMLRRARSFYETMNKRRTVRFFSSEPVSRDVIELAIGAAASAPSGANKQPWHFVVVDSAPLKREIRVAAEQAEQEFYAQRATPEWLADLAPLGTDWRKPFLEEAPYLIVVFQRLYELKPDGSRAKLYYTSESVGLASGLLIAALHQAGLVTVTHTPAPMGFLAKVLQRPVNERPYLLLPVGLPAADATVPEIQRKALDEVLSFNRK